MTTNLMPVPDGMLAINSKSKKLLPHEYAKTPKATAYELGITDPQFARMMLTRNPDCITGLRMMCEMAMMRYTGARASDIIHMRPEHIMLDEGTNGKIYFANPKYGRPYTVPISPRLKPILEKYLSAMPALHAEVSVYNPATRRVEGPYLCQWLFPAMRDSHWKNSFNGQGQRRDELEGWAKKGEAQSYNNLLTTVKRSATEAGIRNQKVTCHKLRKAFGGELHAAGVPIGTISALLNHKSIATTQVYLGINDRDIEAAIVNTYHPEEGTAQLWATDFSIERS